MPRRATGHAGRWARRLGKLLGWTLLLAVVLPVATLQILRLPGGRAGLRRIVLAQTKATLPGLSFGAIRGDFTTALTIDDLVLRDRFGGEAIRVDRVGLRYQLAPLAENRVQVDAIELLRPRVQVRPTKSGALNLAELLAPTPPEPAPAAGPLAWRVRVAALRIDGGELLLATTPGQTLRVSGLDLRAAARLGPGAGPGDLSSALSLERLAARIALPDGRVVQTTVRGEAVSDARLGARFEVDAALDRQRRAKLALRANGPLERLTFALQLDALAGGGRLDLAGWVGVVGPNAPRYEANLALTRFDPQALLAELPAARATLRLRVAGAGVPPAEGSRARVALDAGPLSALGYTVDELALRASAAGGDWKVDTLRATAAAARLRVALSGAGDLQQGQARWRITAADLGRLPLPRGTPRLGGTLRLAGAARGRFSGPLAVELDVGGEQLAVDAVRVQRLTLQGALRGLRPAAKSPAALLAALRGALTLRASGITPAAGASPIDRAELTLSGAQRALSITARADAPAAGLKADVALRAAVGRQQAVVTLGKLRLHARGHRVLLLNEPEVRYGYRGDVETSALRLRALGGELTLSGRFAPRSFPRIVADVQLARVRVPEGPRVSGRLQATVGRRAVAASLAAELDEAPGTIALTARLPARYRRGAALPRIDEESPLVVAVKTPPLPLSLLQRHVPHLRLGGAAAVAVAVAGTLRHPRAELSVALARARWAPYVDDASGRLTLATEDARTRVTANVSLNGRPGLRIDASLATGGRSLAAQLSGGAGALEQVAAKLRLDIPVLDLALLQPLHPGLGRLRGALFAQLGTAGTLSRSRTTLRAGLRRLALDGQRIGDLTANATVDLSRAHTAVRFDVLENGQLLLSGTASAPLGVAGLRTGGLPRALPLTADLRIADYPLGRLARVLRPATPAGGTLRGAFSVRGSTRAPVVRGELALRRARFGDAALGDLRASARFADERVAAQLRFDQAGGAGTMRGKADVDLRRQRLAVRLSGSRFDIGPLQHIVPTIRESAGKLQLDLRIDGPLAKPRLAGQAKLAQGALRLTGLPRFSNLRADVAFTPEKVALRALHLESGGALDARGEVVLRDLAPRRFSIDARATDLRLTFGNVKDARFNGPIALRGELDGRRLTARVVLDESRLRIPEISGGAELHPTAPPKDVLFVDARGRSAGQAPEARAAAAQRGGGGATPAAPPGATLALAVQTTPLFVNGKDADVEVQTDLNIATDARGRPRIRGSVRLRRGWVRILKHRYDVEEALLLFSGEPEPNPALQISLSHRFPEAQIFIDLGGTAHAPTLDLRSEPPIYDRSQILSLILTGRVAPFESGNEVDRSMAVAGAVSQVLLGGIADWLAPKVGLDVASISLDPQQDEKGETRIRARSELGKFVTERLYLGYRHVWGAEAEENQNEGLLEYRITARWLLLTVFGDAGVGGLDLFWIYRY